MQQNKMQQTQTPFQHHSSYCKTNCNEHRKNIVLTLVITTISFRLGLSDMFVTDNEQVSRII